MAKKAAKSNSISTDAAAVSVKKSVAPRGKKHLKAQSGGIMAAVESFVGAITNKPVEPPAPAENVVDVEEQTNIPAPVNVAPETETAPLVQTAAAGAGSSGTATAAAPARAKDVRHEDIAALAYELYLDRKGSPGSSNDDWARAEQILRSR